MLPLVKSLSLTVARPCSFGKFLRTAGPSNTREGQERHHEPKQVLRTPANFCEPLGQTIRIFLQTAYPIGLALTILEQPCPPQSRQCSMSHSPTQRKHQATMRGLWDLRGTVVNCRTPRKQPVAQPHFAIIWVLDPSLATSIQSPLLACGRVTAMLPGMDPGNLNILLQTSSSPLEVGETKTGMKNDSGKRAMPLNRNEEGSRPSTLALLDP